LHLALNWSWVKANFFKKQLRYDQVLSAIFPLEITDKPDFDRAFQDFLPKFQNTLLQIFILKEAYGFEVSSLQEALILRFSQKDKTGFFSPIAPGIREKS